MKLFKDHYKTLGLPFNASYEDIKRKFRKMALQYHPDTNKGDAFADNRFREIQEAYEVLSHPQTRSNYNREWRLHFPGQSATAVRSQTPESILSDALTLQKKVLGMDELRFNKDGVFAQLTRIISEDNISLLSMEGSAQIKGDIINTIMKTSSGLRARHILQLSGKLLLLVKPGEPLSIAILSWQKNARQTAIWEKYKPLFALLIAVVLCLLIYLVT